MLSLFLSYFYLILSTFQLIISSWPFPVHPFSSSPWLYMDKCIILGRKRELPGLRSMVLVDMHDHDSLRRPVHLAYHRQWYDAVETKYISVDAFVSI